MGFFYRLNQFWSAITDRPTAQDLEEVKKLLTPALMALFLRQQSHEQVHSLRVYHRLLVAGERSRELLTAALLHDVGKSYAPMQIWERVLVVVGRALAPDWVDHLGQSRLENKHWSFLRRAFEIAAQHPRWGAELAESAGASPLTVRLIQRHQDKTGRRSTASGPGGLEPHDGDDEDELLTKLQAVDDES